MSERKGSDGSESSAYAAMPGEAPHNVGASAMKAFAHPLRMAMYTYLNDHGAATSTTLAQHLGESTGQTSYHLRQLEKHGFVEEDSARGTGRERWWKPVGFTVREAFVTPTAATSAQLDALLAHQLSDRFEKLQRWLGRVGDEETVWREASLDSTSTAALTAPQTRALAEELLEVVERHTEAAQAGDDEAAVAGESDAEAEETRRIRVYLSVFPLGDD
ncbi:winged helix-turn-helix domain-containing protein [Brevibacterium senegalense]|uniref:winged helix-turn-helix domain-containing protein n=1 Tax=Brevibacterium senegalense TaxID=1033736 RepID=UPI000319C2EE|nr:helix-turn-helix domain-containing protein [Brevibacterium senegalense]